MRRLNGSGKIGSPDPSPLEAVTRLTEAALADDAPRPIIIGICGAQGSGKSTMAGALARRFEADGVVTVVLSIDDLYLTRAQRQALARQVHPLLATRGVPGTHDVALGLRFFEEIALREPTRLPRFDKARDDRVPPELWDEVPSNVELIIFEGWCVGAVPEPASALAAPVNALERDEDPEGIWRWFANDALAGDYQRLFARLNRLVLLAAPAFDVVERWRIEQEQGLREQSGDGMSDAQVARFVRFYERLTRHILREMPGRADLTVRLGEDRSAKQVSFRNVE